MSDTVPKVAIIVAHPDDETLWAGGTMLLHPEWVVRVASLCRGRDPDRAPRFHAALARLKAEGCMADVDDEPEQRPLAEGEVRAAVLDLVGGDHYDLLLTHGPAGEYTRHRRHEEVSRAVASLWTEARSVRGPPLALRLRRRRRRPCAPPPGGRARALSLTPGFVAREASRDHGSLWLLAGQLRSLLDATRGGVLVLRQPREV